MKMWLSEVPEVCDVCGKPFGKYFVDGKVKMGGWGLMCTRCHELYGFGTGIGKGQIYLLDTKELIDGGLEEESEDA